MTVPDVFTLASELGRDARDLTGIHQHSLLGPGLVRLGRSHGTAQPDVAQDTAGRSLSHCLGIDHAAEPLPIKDLKRYQMQMNGVCINRRVVNLPYLYMTKPGFLSDRIVP